MAEINTASPNQDLEAIIERSQIAQERGLLAGVPPGVGVREPGVYNGDPLYGLDIGVAPSTEEDAGNFFGFRINNKLFNPDTTVVTPRYQQEIENASNPGTGVAPSERTQQASSITRIGTGVARPDRTVDASLALGAEVGLRNNREQEKGNFLENLLGQIDLNKLLNSKTVKLLLEGVAGMSGEQQRSGGSALSGFTTSLNQARADDQQAMLNEQDRLLEQSRYDASAAASQVVAARLARQADMAETRFSERGDVKPLVLTTAVKETLQGLIDSNPGIGAWIDNADGNSFLGFTFGKTGDDVTDQLMSLIVKAQNERKGSLIDAFNFVASQLSSGGSSAPATPDTGVADPSVNWESARMRKEPSE